MNTYNILLRAHSGFRYVVLLLIIIALIQSLAGWLGQKSYTESNRKINSFAMVSAQIQFTLGIILYFFSPLVMFNDFSSAMKNDISRYWTVEHAGMMIIAIALISIGHSRSKKAIDAISKHRSVAIFYGTGILVIIFAILQSERPLLGR